MTQNIQLKVEIFQEDDLYVGICPALDVSSFGETLSEAKASVQEALEAFIEECTEMKTLDNVLEEAGFTFIDGTWMYPQPVAVEMVTL